jgi:hypothetical protein
MSRVASLTITTHLLSDGSFEVEIPDFDGSEFARTFASTAATALNEAGQYVESVLFDQAVPGDRVNTWRKRQSTRAKESHAD